jgi:DNA-binding SARP family transcriptional activator
VLILKLFGGASLESANGTGYSGPSLQRHRIALLAVLATHRPRAMPREKLMELLWPERDAAQARRLLNQSVYVLRRAFGEEAILTTVDALRLNPDVVRCDVVEFEECAAAGELARAVRLYAGPFLDGFFLDDAPDLERWVAEERSRLAGLQAKVLLGLAESSESRGDARVAADWLKALIAHDPSSSGAVLRLMRVLESSGDPAGALLQAAAHERLLQEELGVGLPQEITAIVERLHGSAASGGPPLASGGTARRAGIHVADAVAGNSQEEPSAHAPPAHLRPWKLVASGASAILVCGFLAWRLWGPGESQVPAAADAWLGDDGQMLPPERRTSSIAAYELFVRASDPAALRDVTAAQQALEDFRQAVALDPGYAAAWLGLARMTMRVGAAQPGDIPAANALSASLAAVDRAVKLDDTIAEAYALRALLQLLEFDYPAAETSFARALALDPSLGVARQWRVGLFLWTARSAEALAEAERAAALDPVSPAAQAEVARALGANGRCREALARLERLEGVDPPLLRVPSISAECKGQMRMWQSAVADLRAAPGDRGPLDQALLGFLLAKAGDREEALGILNALDERRRIGSGGAFPVAVVHAGLGNRDEALTTLRQALDDRSLQATHHHFTALRPVLDALAADARLGQIPQLSALVRSADLSAPRR